MARPESWTPEQDELLMRLWAENKSCSEIAAQFEKRSRNAIIGRVHRLRLDNRPNPAKIDFSRPRKKYERRHAVEGGKREPVLRMKPSTARVVPLTVATVNLKPLPVLLVAKPDPNKPGLVDLKPGHCKFPHGDPGTDDFHFCGAKTERDGSPYCDYHQSIAYQAKQRRAA